MLDAHPHISAGPESGFLHYLEPILHEQWPRLQLFGRDKAQWRQAIAAFFSDFQLEYAQKRGKHRWLDKTPVYTRHLDFVNEIFPESQMIHIIRDGRDVANSHQSRWGKQRAWRSIAKWQQHIRLARAFGAQAGPGRYRELRYEALVAHPEPELRVLLEYLHEPWDAQVLHYGESEHDYTSNYQQYTGKHRQAVESGQVYSSRIGAWRQELNPLLKVALRLRAGTMLRDLGYL